MTKGHPLGVPVRGDPQGPYRQLVIKLTKGLGA